MDSTIHFRDTDFAYPAALNICVLKDVLLDIAPGARVAIVGASSSGNSTLAALLQGPALIRARVRYITIGGVSLSVIDVGHLRTHVAIVSQAPNLFNTSIAHKLRYGDAATRWVVTQDVRRGTQRTHMHDFIMGLPQGYDAPVGKNTALLLGAQVQRLQIARALAPPQSSLCLTTHECPSSLGVESQAVH